MIRIASKLLTVLLGASAAAQVEVQTLVGAPGQGLGASLCALGDVNGDGICDLAVGDAAGGVVRVFAGGPGTNPLLWSFTGSFRTLLGPGDLNVDGKADLVVGRPDVSGPWGCGNGEVVALSGADGAVLWTFDNSNLAGDSFWSTTGAHAIGASLAGGVDLTQDGIPDVVVGAPEADSCVNWVHEGTVFKLDGLTGQWLEYNAFLSLSTGFCSHDFGTSLAVGNDIDLDGVRDIHVGAPMPACQSTAGVGNGHRYTVSGTNLTHITGQYGPTGTFRFGSKLLWVPGPGLCIVYWSGGQHWLRENGALGFPVHLVPQSSVGAFHALLAIGDLDHDGAAEYAVGAGLGLASGPVSIRKANTPANLMQLPPPSTGTGWGSALAWADFSGDGLEDLIVGEPGSTTGGAGSGAVHVITLVRTATPYCQSETNSAGCAPAVSSTGTASAASGQPFRINASGVLNQKFGILFYGFSPQQAPFQGGHSCIRPPTARTPVQASGGSPAGTDCSGSFTYEFNAHIAGGTDPRLAVGVLTFAQYWSRDPADASRTNLSNALAFLIAP